jgi:hypothetical protein
VLEKNFCFLGFADSKRDLHHLVRELNKSVEQINSFTFDPAYEKIHPFVSDDFQYSRNLPVGRDDDGKHLGLKLKHESCNLLHRYFEELQGTAWKISNYYKQADANTKYAIRQLNNLCHEIESWVLSYRKSIIEPEWVRPSQITTFLNAPRHNLQEEDFTETVLMSSVFDNCDLGSAIFENTNLEKSDFKTAFNFNINPEKNRLKGAKFSKENLYGLLSDYKIIIE